MTHVWEVTATVTFMVRAPSDEEAMAFAQASIDDPDILSLADAALTLRMVDPAFPQAGD